MDVLGSDPVDMVLLDIQMPNLDGHGVLERMKSDAQLSHIPVVVISGSEGMDAVARCIEIGAEDLLPKPFKR
jgi:CheY-like chemotaxis protein